MEELLQKEFAGHLAEDQSGTGEIVVYQPDDITRLEVRVLNDSVWLNRAQMASLFGRDVKTIGKHIANALREELRSVSTVANFATVQREGSRIVERQMEYYNLDMVLSVGYRVKSERGILFRRWANELLKGYLFRGYSLPDRVCRIERRLDEQEKKIDFFVRTSLPPIEGIFYDGQIFDAYVFVADLIRSARQSIVLIDNYIDDSVLIMLSKRTTGVSAEILTCRLPQTLLLDVQKHNAQYAPITLKQVKNIHDRFLIIDDTVYHIGASLKDLGRKLFAFSKMSIPVQCLF